MKLKRHLYISVIVVLVLGANIFTTVTIASKLCDLKQKAIEDIKGDELSEIHSIIDENIDKAKLQADTVKNSAGESILNSYSDSKILANDLSSVGDKKVYHILQDSITGKYLNVTNIDTDNNDMFVWIPNIGKVADTSKNCAFEKGEAVTTEGEIAKQFNKTLANIAIPSFVNQENRKYTFWQYLESPEGFYTPQTMDISEIDKLYNLYGYKGLRYIEFLVPSYLRQNTDLLGVPDVDQNGVKTNNNKIIFVQGFNIVDALEANHSSMLSHYNDLLKFTEDKYNTEINSIRALGALVSVILLLGFVSLVMEINRVGAEINSSKT